MSKPPSRGKCFWQCLGLALLLVIGTLMYQQAERRYGEATYPLTYTAEVSAAAVTYGIAPSLIYAVIHTESEFDPTAISPAGAKGLMQLTDQTYLWALQREYAADPKASPFSSADEIKEQLNMEALFDPATNIRYGAYVLSLLKEQFPAEETALAAYNAGQGHVKEWLANPAYSSDGSTLTNIPFEETKTYVQRVLAARRQYQIVYAMA